MRDHRGHRRFPTPAAHRAVTVTVALLLLTGCSGTGPRDEAPHVITFVDASEQVLLPEDRLPPGMVPGEGYGPMLHWADTDQLVLTTFGSSSCPDSVAELSVTEEGHQQVVLADPSGRRGPCTADLGPRQLRIPVLDEARQAGRDRGTGLTVWVRTAGEHYGEVTEFAMGSGEAEATVRIDVG